MGTWVTNWASQSRENVTLQELAQLPLKMIQDATSANDPGKMDDAILKTLRSAIAPMVEVVRAEKAQGKELTDIQHVVLSMGHCLDLWTEADQKIAIALTVGLPGRENGLISWRHSLRKHWRLAR